MRVLEVTHRYPPALGGVERQVQGLARGLVVRGHSVEVVTTDLSRDRPFARLPPGPFEDAVPVRRHRVVRTLPAPHGLGLIAPGMARDVYRSSADVVHAHAFGMAPTWMSALVRRVKRTPLVIETHFDAGRGTSGWRTYARAVARLTLAPADRIVAHTKIESELLVSIGVDADRITQIPAGIDVAEFAGLPARTPTQGRLTALFVGRLDPERKGLDSMVRALAKVPEGHRPRLRLVGEDWGGKDPAIRLAGELGVGEWVTATGPLPRDQVVREYGRADLFVLPSLFECTPAVLMEAMAAGLPIVTTRVGGVAEVVLEGQTALLCPPNDPESLAAAVSRLVEDASLRDRFGRAGVDRAQLFGWDQVVPKWIRLFDGLGRAG
ncbi:MAG: glycosyltransferase family 4 protein [Thermoplasmata archaeon]|nr:glycosyltransferase family 4 protein [Thermoplasmata archaeon]